MRRKRNYVCPGLSSGGGAGCETLGAGTVDPFDAVSMLANLWQQMQVR